MRSCYGRYIGVGKREEVQLFYYFIESEHDPESDPLMVWLTGGPGCTSLSSIFMEHIVTIYNNIAHTRRLGRRFSVVVTLSLFHGLKQPNAHTGKWTPGSETWGITLFDTLNCKYTGPLSFNYTGVYYNHSTSTWETDLPTLELNPYSWTKFASVLFIESPVGTGFSYGTTAESYNTVDIIASKQIYEFVKKWFMVHPYFATNPFYVGASSYCGLIAPFITQQIVYGIALTPNNIYTP
ncbi:Serine carboxypeptidase-like 18 [Bienertia sinuspersici]